MAVHTPTRSATKPIKSADGPCGCGCGSSPKTCTCCCLECFERPLYHCGHLLTDADLSLQMRYVVEKNKLRNRALTGHGVVCGLKLTCEDDCRGTIAIHEGYAIDDCGNDIVVCERACFDVIAALRAKKLIVEEDPNDPCDPAEQGQRDLHRCRFRQCFYVTICYAEDDADFETPFQVGCASGPQDCVPTRVKEGFRLDVTDQLPPHLSDLDRIERRMLQCFKLFVDSPVGRLIQLKLDVLEGIVAGKAVREQGDRDANCELFCILKAHFQQQIKACPDALTCDLARQVAHLNCPEAGGDRYAAAMQDAFARLFELMHIYQYDCVLADLVLDCACPDEACCIVLGSVEVEDNRLLRVSNAHRHYVWSFANLPQLLVNAALNGGLGGGATIGGHEGEGMVKDGACPPDYGPFSMEAFLREFRVDGSGRYLAASSPVRALKSLQTSIGNSFDFSNSSAVATALFRQQKADILPRLAETLGLRASVADAAVEVQPLNPMQALLSESLLRPLDTIRAYSGETAFRQVLPDYVASVSPERARQEAANAPSPDIARLNEELAQRDKTIADLTSRLDALADRVKKLEPQPRQPKTPS